MFKVTRNIPEYVFGRGAIDALFESVPPIRHEQGVILFVVDHFFKGSSLHDRLASNSAFQVHFCDSTHEPTTEAIDALVAGFKERQAALPASVVGIGGGTAMDTAKAVSNLFTNGGKSEDYQGWDLVKRPGVYKVGVPTISGTGAEASRTCVLLNEKKNLKMGMNSDYTLFDFLILDPDLSASVPRDQFFYTGMDTYIHCVESLAGAHRHPVADAYSREALRLCRDVFGSDDMQTPENREKLMVASLLGGTAIANSFVGVVHPFSAGLSVVLGLHHCVANCIVMNQMQEFYPKEASEFTQMRSRQSVSLPVNVTGSLGGPEFERLYAATVVHEKPLVNALGARFRDILSPEKVSAIFRAM